ncbi:MAG: ABC transporter permease, partial [Verrucomicrobiota bacterium]|nr:ABC transporter permease [Verrucomicrobiota bacterium]
MNDLHYAIRQLRKSPGFSALAILTLTLGIGLNTTIFSLVNDLFLRGLPFQEPDRVLQLATRLKDRADDFPMSAPRFLMFKEAQTIFSGFAAENGFASTVTG